MDHTIYINQYLDNELSPEERQAFETALTSDEVLQKNLSQEQAIREQFEFEKTKLSVLALHEQKKKKAEQERLIQEQFDFEKTKNDVLALHERKKAEKNKEAKIVILPQKNNWYRYAIAASMIGLMLTGAWFFNRNSNTQNIVIQEVVNPNDTIKQLNIIPDNKVVDENKNENVVVNTPKKQKPIIQDKSKEEPIKTPSDITAQDNKGKIVIDNSLNNKALANNNEKKLLKNSPNDIKGKGKLKQAIRWDPISYSMGLALGTFYTAQMKDVKTTVMSANDSNTFENATINLKNGEKEVAYKQLATLYKEKPNDADVILFFALAAYKMDKKEEAIKLLETIKEKNKDVAEFLEKIK